MLGSNTYGPAGPFNAAGIRVRRQCQLSRRENGVSVPTVVHRDYASGNRNRVGVLAVDVGRSGCDAYYPVWILVDSPNELC